jgi:hypothetical protein
LYRRLSVNAAGKKAKGIPLGVSTLPNEFHETTGICGLLVYRKSLPKRNHSDLCVRGQVGHSRMTRSLANFVANGESIVRLGEGTANQRSPKGQEVRPRLERSTRIAQPIRHHASSSSAQGES